MIRFALALFLAFTGAASAQGLWEPQPAHGGGGGGGSCTGGYQGPGDVVAGAAVWYGLRSYSCAYATGANKGALLLRASDSTTLDILIKADGTFDKSAASTFCNATTCTVQTWYDQSGNGNDATQATAADQPTLSFNCVNTSLPCLIFASPTVLNSTVAALTSAATLTGSGVGNQTGSFTSDSPFASGSTDLFGLGNAAVGANQAEVFPGSTRTPSTTASNSNWHALQFIFNGSSSFVSVDGVAGTSGGTGTAAWGSSTYIGKGAINASYMTGKMTEVGIWASNLSGTLQTNMCHNQYLYWGTVLAC
jgi:Alpha-L-arabinofuranosidase B, catalytic